MPQVTKAAHQTGDFFVDYEEKVFPDVKADPGEKALVTFHTVAFEGSIGFVNLLQNFTNQINKFMSEGGKVYACRFALQALYGHGEPSLIPGIIPINPLDVLDIVLMHRKDNAFILDTWTL
jgi:hypothetical protein